MEKHIVGFAHHNLFYIVPLTNLPGNFLRLLTKIAYGSAISSLEVLMHPSTLQENMQSFKTEHIETELLSILK